MKKYSDIELTDENAAVAAEKLLSDVAECKAFLLDVLKMAQRLEDSVELISRIILCGDMMAEMIRLGRPDHARDLWMSFRDGDEDKGDGDAHS